MYVRTNTELFPSVSNFEKYFFFLFFQIAGMWVVADTSIPKLDALHVYGQLEISNDLPKITLSVSYIYIRGGRLILGWENKPYPGEAIIELKGTKHAPSFPVNSGPNLGSSFIG